MMEPPTLIPHSDEAMADDTFDSVESSQTQTQTQPTQQASQPLLGHLDSHLWGYLQPCNAALSRIDFWKANPTYSIGRSADRGVNDITLKGFKVSE